MLHTRNHVKGSSVIQSLVVAYLINGFWKFWVPRKANRVHSFENTGGMLQVCGVAGLVCIEPSDFTIPGLRV